MVNPIQILVISSESVTFLVWIKIITRNVKSKFELKFQQSISHKKFDFFKQEYLPLSRLLKFLKALFWRPEHAQSQMHKINMLNMIKVSNKGNQNGNIVKLYIYRVSLVSNWRRIKNPVKRLRWSRSLRAVNCFHRKLQLKC